VSTWSDCASSDSRLSSIPAIRPRIILAEYAWPRLRQWPISSKGSRAVERNCSRRSARRVLIRLRSPEQAPLYCGPSRSQKADNVPTGMRLPMSGFAPASTPRALTALLRTSPSGSRLALTKAATGRSDWPAQPSAATAVARWRASAGASTTCSMIFSTCSAYSWSANCFARATRSSKRE
jgi:hypothetical protein